METELVARMDSDDICLPDRFEKQAAQFEADPSLEILGGGIEEFYVDSAGAEFRRIRLYPKWTVAASATLYRGTPAAHPTLMMKTALLKEFGYSESTKCNEDIDLWFRLLCAGHRIRTLQEPVLRFRITDGTFSRRSVSKALSEFSIYSANLRKINGVSWNGILPLARLASRFFPRTLSRKLYLSRKRQNLFKENLMKVTSLGNHVFTKNGHLYEALLQFEENGVQMIKAVQLDSPSKPVVEVPADEVQLFKTNESVDVSLNVEKL